MNLNQETIEGKNLLNATRLFIFDKDCVWTFVPADNVLRFFLYFHESSPDTQTSFVCVKMNIRLSDNSKLSNNVLAMRARTQTVIAATYDCDGRGRCERKQRRKRCRPGEKTRPPQ